MEPDILISDECLKRRPSAVSFNVPETPYESDLSTIYGDQFDFEEVPPRTVSINDRRVIDPDAVDFYRRPSTHSSSFDISSALPTDSLMIGISIVYAFVMSIIGFLIPISEALTESWLDTIYGAVFITYQLTIGILFLLYMQFYHLIKRHSRQSTSLKGDGSTGNCRSDSSRSKGVFGSRRKSIAGSTIWVDMASFGDVFTHPETSLFLRVGTLVFSLGNLVYYGFEIAGYMNMSDACKSQYRFGWTFYLRLAFILLQTYFLFKNSGVSLNKHIHCVWFGMLHLISTNICLWFRTVVHEIMEEVAHFQHSDDHDTKNYGVTDNTVHKEVDSNYTKLVCKDDLLPTLSLYLFPFILEYSLIAVGTITSLLHVMVVSKNAHGQRIQDIRNNFRVVSLRRRNATQDVEEEQLEDTTSRVDQPNILGKAHRGFFAAALVIAGIIAAVILFYLLPQRKQDACLPSLIYQATDLCLHVFLLGGCVLGFVQMRPLGFIPKTISTDDVLIMISMCGSVMYDAAEIIATSDALSRPNPDKRIDVLRLSASLVASVQVVLQGLFLICSLRRYPSDTSHVENKPGRGAITALVIGNASVWVFQTILAKGTDMKSPQAFYGEVPWLMLMDVNLPLALFFCFHSSICFADVWHHAYAPLEGDSQLSRSNSMSIARDWSSAASCSKIANGGPVLEMNSSPIFSVSKSGRSSSTGNLWEESTVQARTNIQRSMSTASLSLTLSRTHKKDRSNFITVI